ncbi:MAG: ECF transporter S component [Candidatus Nanopelagicales bacterium]|jgi:energy-coupling factor transport system substrate-specific component|nr:ECF transporter S component [Candidatus Nanopelagicales bacterium]
MQRRWRTLDIVTAAVLAVVSGVVFWAWNLAWTATGPAFAAFPPAQSLLYGVWLVPGVLAMLVLRLPGAALAGAFLAAAVSWLLGAWWGLSVLWYGVLQGLLPELVFAAGRYRAFGPGVAVAAGAAAGLVPGVLDPVFWYPEWSAAWKLVWLLGCVASSALVAGLGSHALAGRLARSGVLDAFPIGRERVSA